MNRAQHLQWAKERALAYLQPAAQPARPRYADQRGLHHPARPAHVSAEQLRDAWASFVSDLGKHPETARHQAIELGTLEQLMGGLNTADKLRAFISGTH